ncbi:MAG: hypothetical protein ABIR34_00290 [Marmoricola sp.]
MTANVETALRLGWAVAEARGRNWPHGPRPKAAPLPPAPGDVLPLRSQRTGSASRREAVRVLFSLARQLQLDAADDFEAELTEVLAPFTPAGDASLVEDAEKDAGPRWRRIANCFIDWDGRIQDELNQRDEHLANAYLLGRGVSECYWGLGPEEAWTSEGQVTAVSPVFLLGEERRHELTRMLGRLGPDTIHPLSAAGISGSLEAWGDVAADETWSRDPQMRALLYEQVRQWYQLLMLGQDPTTLIRPYARLTSTRYLVRAARTFLPQAILAVIALGLVAGFFVVTGFRGTSWVSPILATGGFGAFALAGLLARGQSAAQRLVTRMRQDAYTDLVAISVAIVPPYPSEAGGPTLRQARKQLERAVRRRLLTPPTSPPPG